jgi:hypothetical protein
MMRSKYLFAAAAFAAGIVFGGGAHAVVPVKVQGKAVEAVSPLAEAGHGKWRKRGWRGHHARRGHRRFHGSYGRRHRFRPRFYDPFLYDYGFSPFSYGFGYGGGYGYDDDFGYIGGYGYGGGYGNCHPRRYHLGY